MPYLVQDGKITAERIVSMHLFASKPQPFPFHIYLVSTCYERGNWPDNRTKYLQLIRPKNCHTTLKIQILNGEEVLTGVSRKTINGPNSEGYYKVPIRVGLIPENVDEIQVRLEWKTAVTPIEHTIMISKPN